MLYFIGTRVFNTLKMTNPVESGPEAASKGSRGILGKALKLTGILLLLLLAFVLIFPGFFKARLIQMVENELARRFRAEITFEDVRVDLWRAFPRMNLGLEEIQVLGIESFQGDTLLRLESLDLRIDLNSVIGGKELDIHSLHLEGPELYARIDREHGPNWLITREVSTDSSSIVLDLQRYSIANAILHYRDEVAGTEAEFLELGHRGSLRLDGQSYELDAVTEVGSASLYASGAQWLRDQSLELAGLALIDLEQSSWMLEEYVLLSSGLHINIDGGINLDAGIPNADLSFGLQESSLEELIALIPEAWQSQAGDWEASGQLAFNGFLKGSWEAGNWPESRGDLNLKDGAMSMDAGTEPARLEKLNVAMGWKLPAGPLSGLSLAFDQVQGQLQQGAERGSFDFSGRIDDPLQKMKVEGSARADLNLRLLEPFLGGEALGIDHLEGDLELDATVSGSLAEAMKGRHDRLKWSGDMKVANGMYESDLLPMPVYFDQLDLILAPVRFQLNKAMLRAGNSDLSLTGSLEDPLRTLLQGDGIRTNLRMESGMLDLNEWVIDSSASSGGSGTRYREIPEGITASVEVPNISALEVEDLKLAQVSGTARIDQGVLTVERAKGKGLGGQLEGTGTYSVPESGVPEMKLGIKAEQLDMTQTIDAFDVLSQIAPIAPLLKGRLNTEFVLSGSLDEALYPKLNTLDGEIFTQLLNADWIGELPLSDGIIGQGLSRYIETDKLQDFRLDGIRTWFELTDGRVALEEPVLLRNADAAMALSGSHGLDMTMDYRLELDVPTSWLGIAGTGISALSSRLGELGLPGFSGSGSQNPDRLLMVFSLTGPWNKPQLKPLSVGPVGQGSSVAESIEEEIRDRAEEEAESILQEGVEEAIGQEIPVELDSLSNLGEQAEEIVGQAIDSARQGLEDAVKEELEDQFENQVDDLFDGLFGGRKHKKGDKP